MGGASGCTPPCQAELATPPQEGNCWCRTHTTTPPGCPPPLQRRGIAASRGGELPCADTRTPPRQAELDTPPQEGNCLARTSGVSLIVRRTPPRQAELDTPPQEGNCRLRRRGMVWQCGLKKMSAIWRKISFTGR